MAHARSTNQSQRPVATVVSYKKNSYLSVYNNFYRLIALSSKIMWYLSFGSVHLRRMYVTHKRYSFECDIYFLRVKITIAALSQ